MRSRFELLLCFLIFVPGCTTSVVANVYYVSPSGSDLASGLSPSMAWKTIARMNSFQFRPGDKVLFEGGQTFDGSVLLEANDGGTTNAPVIIASYGNGTANIRAGTNTAIAIQDAEHIDIENLVLTGDGPHENIGCGVIAENISNTNRLSGLRLANLEIAGFGKHGIIVTGRASGFSDVAIENCKVHNNLRGGIEVAGKLPWDTTNYAHSNVVVNGCHSYSNLGDEKFSQNHSGSGIVFYQVDTGRISRSAAWDNGAHCPAKGGGPVGIWTCSSRRVIIEYCESFANKTRGLDGGGFDIDGGSEECVLQNNYSHDNTGPGLMVYSYPYTGHRDRKNIVRFNVSVNDAVQSDRYAGLWIRTDGKNLGGVEIYNNTVVTTGPNAAYIHGRSVEAKLSNNIFLCGISGTPLRVTEGSEQIRLQNNLYWRSGAPFLIHWNDRAFSSLNEFQEQIKQEIHEGGPEGTFMDPKLSLAALTILNNPLGDFGGLQRFRPSVPELGGRGKRIFAQVDPAQPIHDILGNRIEQNGPLPLGAIGTGR